MHPQSQTPILTPAVCNSSESHVDDDKVIILKCLIDQMMQKINKLKSKQSSHPKEETVTPSTNMENSDSDHEINIVDVMDNDNNQLNPNDQSDPKYDMC